jgi:hypothetical protein
MGDLVPKKLFLNAGVQELTNSNAPNFLTHLIVSSAYCLRNCALCGFISK